MTIIERRVARIIDAVAREGDRAVIRFTGKFDGVRLRRTDLRVRGREIAAARRETGPEFARLIRSVARNIARYHRRQITPPQRFRNDHGARVGWFYVPVERAGIYIPAGTAPLVSTALMTIIPARVAGVREIVVCTPPGRGGAVNPYLLAACAELGAGVIIRAGGAQAVAAMAFGTESVPRADLIAGPGNVYVTEAKRQLYGRVGIDMTAGPSEVAIIADEGADPASIAADLLSQAEHDPLSTAALFTTSARVAARVREEVETQSRALPRLKALSRAPARRLKIVRCRTLAAAAARVNLMAPEHLEIMTADPGALLGTIRNAGAIFLGPFTPTAVGDYVAGPSHVLPTGRTARFSSVLSAETFLKRVSVASYDARSLRKAANAVEKLAGIEGLEAHARSVRLRLRGNIRRGR